MTTKAVARKKAAAVNRISIKTKGRTLTLAELVAGAKRAKVKPELVELVMADGLPIVEAYGGTGSPLESGALCVGAVTLWLYDKA